MSRLNDLIKELCPNGVEYKTISDFSKVLRGKRLTTKELDSEAEYPVYHGGLEPLGYYDECNRSGDTVMIINVGASAGTVGYSKNNFWSSDGCYCLEHSDLFINRFIYHYLKNNESFFISKVRKAGIPTLDGKVIEKFKVPVPPLEVQEEIVKILDKFGELEEELEEELEARKSQYEFWSGRLLNKEYEIKFLPELATNLDNKRKPVTKSDRESGNYPYYGASGIVDYVSNYIFDDDLLLVSEDGANLKARSTPIAFSSVGKVWINNHAHVLKFDNMITQKYVEHYLNMIDLNEYITGATQPKLNQENLNKIRINIPSSIEEQEKVVIALERFDKLINDINSGLPAEIELRRKQYEYYRNKLLSFEEV